MFLEIIKNCYSCRKKVQSSTNIISQLSMQFPILIDTYVYKSIDKKLHTISRSACRAGMMGSFSGKTNDSGVHLIRRCVGQDSMTQTRGSTGIDDNCVMQHDIEQTAHLPINIYPGSAAGETTPVQRCVACSQSVRMYVCLLLAYHRYQVRKEQILEAAAKK